MVLRNFILSQMICTTANTPSIRQRLTGNLQGHENRITGLSVADSGLGIATSSWDNAVRVWG
jgi:hypothetical protein